MPSLLPPMLEDEEGAMEQHERDVRLLAHWRSTSATEPPASTP